MAKDMNRDEDGQPPRRYYAHRVADRTVAELLGVCKGLICDALLNDDELEGFKRWLIAHPAAVAGYPGRELAERIVAIYRDGQLDDEERNDLFDYMCSLTGETPEHDQPMNLTTRALFDDPPPVVAIPNREFVFTGRMLYGTRDECEHAIEDRGGHCAQAPRDSTDFLIVGPIASAAWIQSTHGTKLLAAAEIRERGGKVRIVTEEHWITSLDRPALRLV